MPIVKRLTPEERLQQRTKGSLRRVLAYPLLAGLCNPKHMSSVDATPEGLAKLIASFGERDWITRIGWNEKIFAYIYGMVARRADVPGLLDEDRMTQLARHMNAQTTIDKIDEGNGVGLGFRLALIFDMPELLRRYKGPGSLQLPDPQPVKKRFTKLAKHQK